MDYKGACKKLSEEFLEGKIKNSRELELKKSEIASAFNLDKTPRNSDILEYLKDRQEEFVSSWLRNLRI